MTDLSGPMSARASTAIQVGDGTGGGMRDPTLPRAGSAGAWDPIGRATKKAEKIGAKIRKDVIAGGAMGRLRIIIDPTGTTWGRWETAGE